MADFIRDETPPVDCSSRNSYAAMDSSHQVGFSGGREGGGWYCPLTSPPPSLFLLSPVQPIRGLLIEGSRCFRFPVLITQPQFPVPIGHVIVYPRHKVAEDRCYYSPGVQRTDTGSSA